MSPAQQKALDSRALEVAVEARTIAQETRDRVHTEFSDFRRENTEQHNKVADQLSGLRELVSEKVGKVHTRVDWLIRGVIFVCVGIIAWLLTNAPPWQAMQP